MLAIRNQQPYYQLIYIEKGNKHAKQNTKKLLTKGDNFIFKEKLRRSLTLIEIKRFENLTPDGVKLN